MLSIVIVTGGILYIGNRALKRGDTSKFSPVSSAELTAFNFHYNSYDENGKLTTNFISEEIVEYVNKDTKMTNLFEKSFDVKNGYETMNLKAHHGFLDEKNNANLLYLYDGVKSVIFTNSDKDDSTVKENYKYAPKEIHMKSSDMYYNTDNHDFYNNKFVRMYDPKTGNNTTGIGTKGNSETKIINLEKDVRSYYASS